MNQNGGILTYFDERFKQIENLWRQVTPENKLYCFSEKKVLGLGALKNNQYHLVLEIRREL